MRFKKGHIISNRHCPSMCLLVQDSDTDSYSIIIIKPFYPPIQDENPSMKCTREYIEGYYVLLTDAFEVEE